jgi:hypothetical protein
MFNNDNFCLERDQCERLNNLFEKRINPERSKFCADLNNFINIKAIFSSKQKCEETQPEKIEFNRRYFCRRQDSYLHKENDFLNKKKNRSPQSIDNHINNLIPKKFGSLNTSTMIFKVKICENSNIKLNVIKSKKDVLLNKNFTEGMSKKSTESTELKVRHLSKGNSQVSIQLNTKFISLLGEAREWLENKNIKKKELKKNLNKYLKTKKFGYTLKKNNQNKNEETEVSSLDYYNELISKMNLQEKDDILVRLYYSIDIFKNKEHVVNILFDELTNNDQKIKKNNIAKIIKNWIRKNFEEDFKEVSKKHELKKKKENTQLKEKDNNNKETNSDFFESNFESFILEYDKILKTDEKQKNDEIKKEIFDYIIKIKGEEDPEDYLIKMTKLVYLSKLKDAKFQKFLEIDKEVQEIKKKRQKCRNELYKLYQTKNLEGLLFLSDQFYIDKKISIKIHDVEEFKNKIRNIKGYEDFNLELSEEEKLGIQERAFELEKFVSDPVGYLKEKKKI